MTTEPFTPHADSIQTAWVLMCQQSRVSTQPPVEELEAEFDRFIAKVKRDAAREALDGLAEHIDQIASHIVGFRVGSQKAQDVRGYRDTQYPEDVTP